MGTPSSYPCSFILALCLWRGLPVSTRGNTSFTVGVGVVLTSGFHTVPAQHLIGMLGANEMEGERTPWSVGNSKGADWK